VGKNPPGAVTAMKYFFFAFFLLAYGQIFLVNARYPAL
jgi:hypothetical protein